MTRIDEKALAGIVTRYAEAVKRNGIEATTMPLEAIELHFREFLEEALSALEPAPAGAEGWRLLEGRTFAIHHNPNCPKPWLVRLPGRSGVLDLKPYGGVLGRVPNETGDILGFGKTLDEAARAATAGFFPPAPAGKE